MRTGLTTLIRTATRQRARALRSVANPRRLIAGLTLAILALSIPAHAGDDAAFFDGIRAYRAHQYDLAADAFRRAAERGDGEAQFLLGRMYYDGNSLRVDYIQALMWFELAAENGVTVAPRYRDGLAQRMTPEQIGEAKQRAADWRGRHAWRVH